MIRMRSSEPPFASPLIPRASSTTHLASFQPPFYRVVSSWVLSFLETKVQLMATCSYQLFRRINSVVVLPLTMSEILFSILTNVSLLVNGTIFQAIDGRA
jgi:hypothetical protein